MSSSTETKAADDNTTAPAAEGAAEYNSIGSIVAGGEAAAAGLQKIDDCLCVHCGKWGTTNIILTTVPYFREVIIMAFTCDTCGFRSQDIQQGGMIQERGSRHTLTVKTADDLNRQVIKSDKATVRIPELDFEIPEGTQKGLMSTVEGLLCQAVENLRTSLVNNSGHVDAEQVRRRPHTCARSTHTHTRAHTCSHAITLHRRCALSEGPRRSNGPPPGTKRGPSILRPRAGGLSPHRRESFRLC